MDTACFPWRPLGELLVERGILTEVGLEMAITEQRRTGRLLGVILVESGRVGAGELARALAADPEILMLDEPAAGLNPRETAEIDEVIRRIVDRGIAVLLVEHDMKLVMAISERVIVLDHGKCIADGPPQAVRADPEVIRAYLGAEAP